MPPKIESQCTSCNIAFLPNQYRYRKCHRTLLFANTGSKMVTEHLLTHGVGCAACKRALLSGSWHRGLVVESCERALVTQNQHSIPRTNREPSSPDTNGQQPLSSLPRTHRTVSYGAFQAPTPAQSTAPQHPRRSVYRTLTPDQP